MKAIALIVLISVLIIISVYLFILGKREKYWGFRRPGWRRGYPRRGFYRGYYNDYPYRNVYIEDSTDSDDNGSCECINGKPINDNCINGNIPFCNGNICKCGK